MDKEELLLFLDVDGVLNSVVSFNLNNKTNLVLSNENCPVEVLVKLSDDEDFDVREAANFRIKPMQDIYKFNIIKHISRYEEKDGLKDLYKAKDYLEMLIKLEEGDKKND